MNAPPDPDDDRQDLHNVSVDDDLAGAGACGQVHLATGRACTLDKGHAGSCTFVSPDQIEESLGDLHRGEK